MEYKIEIKAKNLEYIKTVNTEQDLKKCIKVIKKLIDFEEDELYTKFKKGLEDLKKDKFERVR